MITVNSEQCVGCGACVNVCPTGAIQLVDGVATVDQTKCRQCEACVAACPKHAISMVTDQKPAVEILDIVPVPPPTPLPVRPSVQMASRVLPWVGAALAFVGREVVPRVAVSLLDAWDRRSQMSVPTAEKPPSTKLIHRPVLDVGGRGRPRRQRRRGRW